MQRWPAWPQHRGDFMQRQLDAGEGPLDMAVLVFIHARFECGLQPLADVAQIVARPEQVGLNFSVVHAHPFQRCHLQDIW